LLNLTHFELLFNVLFVCVIVSEVIEFKMHYTTLYKNVHSLLVRLTRLQTNDYEKEQLEM